MNILLITDLFLLISSIQSLRINCGKSFFSCESNGDIANRDAIIEHELSSEHKGSVRLPLSLFEITAKEAYNEVNNVISNFTSSIFVSGSPLFSSLKQYLSMTRADTKAIKLSYSAHISLSMSKRIKILGGINENIFSIISSNAIKQTILADICPPKTIEICPETQYRSHSGFCNNVVHPLWGSTYEPMQRILKAHYSDGINEFRMSSTQTKLPNPRQISIDIFEEPSLAHKSVTSLFAYWMQFVFSDIVDLSPAQSLSNGISSAIACCNDQKENPNCAPLYVPENDKIYGGRVRCIPYMRTLMSPREDCTLGPREQGNQASSFLDASNIYGSTAGVASKLREYSNGKLRTTTQAHIKLFKLLPYDISNSIACLSKIPWRRCFISGRKDVNILPGITALHTIFVRQHNKIAETLKTLNPEWSDEKLYEESRRIVIAQVQRITFNEFLPVLLGRRNMEKYRLDMHLTGYDSDYDMNVDPSTINEFGAVAEYLFYTIVGNTTGSIRSDGGISYEIPFRKIFNDPNRLYEYGEIENTLRYLLKKPIEAPGNKMSVEFRGYFLGTDEEPGLDLAAYAIQRGRDHGLADFAAIRLKCGLSEVRTFDDFLPLMKEELVVKLSKIYESAKDVDLMIGALLERPQKGSLIGETMACIIGNQFYKLKRGDRFWYENFFAKSAFSEEQLNEIRKTTLTRILCDNANLDTLQMNTFFIDDQYDNMQLLCNSSMIHSVNLNEWKEIEPKKTFLITQDTIDKVIKLAELNVREQQRRDRKNFANSTVNNIIRGSPLYAYGGMMRPKQYSSKISRAATILLETTKLLLRGEKVPEWGRLQSLDIQFLQRILPGIDVSKFVGNYTALLSENGQATVQECMPRMLPCDHTSRFRTHSGWCNNIKSPKFGNAFEPLRHLLTPVYDDGFDAPRSRAKSGKPLPSARTISNVVHVDQIAVHSKFSHMLMQFGQFLDHEMTHTPISRGPNDEILNCTRCDSQQTVSVHCMPIRVPDDDPYFPSHYPTGEPRCLPFARSLLGQLNLGYRNQINQITAFIDGSVIYGSTSCEANSLRMNHGGLLKYTIFGDKNILPQGEQEKDCQSLPHYPCFNAGDERNSHQPGLTAMHTVFLREHNRIAGEFNRINPHWSDERIYQETRRIVIAQQQHIVFAEFLPKIIGYDLAKKNDLLPLKYGYYKGYDDHCDVAISQPFTTAAYRFGHTLVRQMFPRLDNTYHNMSDPIDLTQHFGFVEPIYNRDAGGLDSILLGLLGTPSMAFDRHISNALRNHLFARRGDPHSGMDLVAINILRARDHGVQPYNDFREYCGLKRAHDFNDLLDQISPNTIRALKQVYEDVDDIDLFPGLTSELPRRGALLGETMSCILVEQFKRLKRCDRFYYENDNQASRFTPEQLDEIRKTTLSRILCLNSDFLKAIQPNAFDLPDELMNAQMQCESFPDLNLNLWMERNDCELQGKFIALGETKIITPCMTCTCTNEGVGCHPVKIFDCESLAKEYSYSEIKADTSCIIQCSMLVRNDQFRKL